MDENLLNPRLVAVWDGTHIWVQWEGLPDARYEARLRFKAEGAATWEQWDPVIRPNQSWFAMPRPTKHCIGSSVQAEIRDYIADRPVEDSEADWQRADEATFVK